MRGFGVLGRSAVFILPLPFSPWVRAGFLNLLLFFYTGSGVASMGSLGLAGLVLSGALVTSDYAGYVPWNGWFRILCSFYVAC